MTFMQSEVRAGAYYDSVVLMQLQRALADLPDVVDAGVVMATKANLDLLIDSDMLGEESPQAGADDLLIVVKAENEAAAQDALSQVDELMKRRRSGISQEFRPRSMDAAVKQLPDAAWVLISVPGRYAAGVAREALDFDHHVFLYSDNVSLEDEIDLKKRAREKGLLVMGPDCGTAIVNGVGLGFANRVRHGGIGLVGASGTGLQAITTHIHTLGAGVSQALGTGGRDLKSEVGAITATQALDLLGRDADTNVIVLVSKPPAPEVATRLLAAAQTSGKQVVVDFIGYPPPARQMGNLHFATSLMEAAAIAVELDAGREAVTSDAPEQGASFADGQRYLRGLFSGGTLAYEALLGLQATLAPIYSNVPIVESQRLADALQSQAHSIIDLGEDVFTVGRLHPMMDNDLRVRRLRHEASDPEVALILLDVVLGEGSHPDPSAELAPVIAEIKSGRALDVVAIVIGTDEDPQDVVAQVERLHEAGAVVFRSTSEAVAYVGRRLSRSEVVIERHVDLERFKLPLAAINVGLESFYDSLTSQGAEAVHVDWRPPAGGNEKLMAILAKMKKR